MFLGFFKIDILCLFLEIIV